MDNCLSFAVVLVLIGYCYAYPLYGEEKRQGLIPYPRIGRSYLTGGHPQLAIGLDDVGDDLLEEGIPLRYTRAMFSPRLGRRKRSVETSMDETAGPGDLDFDDLRDMLQNSPWAIVALKDGMDKKAMAAFSPRLGRAMIPRLGRKRSDSTSDSSSMMMDMESADKRAMSAFSPRLGRANIAAFSPRLGRAYERAAAFSPRLGRSSSNSAGSGFHTDSVATEENRS